MSAHVTTPLFRAAAFSLLLAAAALVSCSKEESPIEHPAEDLSETPAEQPAPKYHHYAFALNESETRAILEEDGVYWEENDAVGMFLGGSHAEANVDISTTPKTIALNSPTPVPGGSTAYAYYPYDERNTGAGSTIVRIPREQAGGAVSAMPMAGIPFTVESGDSNGEVWFLNLGAIIDFRVFSASHSNETLRYIVLSDNSGTIAGDGLIDLTAVDPADASTLAFSGWGTNRYSSVIVRREVPVAADKAGAASVYMVVAPGAYVSGTITVVTDRAVYTFSYSDKPLARNTLKRYNMNLDSANAVREILAVPPYEESFTGGIGLFTTDGVKANGNAVWQQSSSYGMVAKAYSDKAYASTSWLYSPWIDLQEVPNATLSFEHVHRYTNQPSTDLTLWVKTDADGDTWHQLTIENYASGSNWTFVNSGDISLLPYVGHNVRLGFKYVSTSDKTRCATWEIKNLSLVATEAPDDDPVSVSSLQYLGCTEVPGLALEDYTQCTDSGTENFGSTTWFAYNTTASTRRVATHTYAYQGKTYRNYTVMVDQTQRCPLWVAYPMHKGAYPNNSLGRTGSWSKNSYDPAFPKAWQSSGSTGDYNGGNGYARGHLCASADRQTVEEGNEQTFYYTNQCPQWQNNFNSGVWSALEGAVQSYTPSAASDTLYVVSGVLFETGNTGSSNDGGTVGRPSHFYKLLMKCTYSGGKISAAQGVAYIYTNEAHTGVNYNDAGFRTTIDAIETRTGFDFFPAVPTDLQNAAESSSTSLW